ncbi:alpha-L-rhamnosidase [Roseibacillus persicicus]|uniref:alpha-L-rhamnosidase n=1 Tax=Roseibacillus persicicus TaxID=454148 RepID=A0A918TKH6_9BACT|nr:alpha-L-rhamnosidase [Roseibacillus persicicus]GHC53262.1 alpha-L-rhamnosidase [Roseibacillus persicicus]
MNFIRLPFYSLLLMLAPHSWAQTLAPSNLQVEYQESPIALGTTKPRLSWQLEATKPAGKDLHQTAYEIQVASNKEQLDEPNLWSTGKVTSTSTHQITYAGVPLSPRSSAVWRVRCWDQDGSPSEWSSPATFTIGLLNGSDWSAKWIASPENPIHETEENVQNFKGTPKGKLHLTPAKHFRKDFEANNPVRALLYATSLGVNTIELNGKRIGDWNLAPGWTSYHNRLHYLTYDVTERIQEGGNTLGATIADGWYAGYVAYGLFVNVAGLDPSRPGRSYYGKYPALRLQLELQYSDGSTKVIGTDPSWKTAFAPHTEADTLMGETYDARLEQDGWSSPGFDDSAWKNAILDEGHKGKLEPHPGVPLRAIEEIKPVSVTEHKPGVFIFNLGQNISGLAKLKVKGKAGDRVTLRFAEILHNDGRMSTENLRCARAIDTYILKGDPEGEIYLPDFTFHGFQYVEVTGYPGTPTLDDITGVVIHSDTPLISEFESSDPILNQIHSNIVWTQRANYFEIPTDCPQRDERMGWTGDAQVYIKAATYNADIASFTTKWLRDLNDDQWDFGPYPNFAPSPFIRKGMNFAAAWGDAGIICPWHFWQVYGDTTVLEEHWEQMEKFMTFRKERDPQNVGTKVGDSGFGDWLALYQPKTPVEFIDLAYHAHTSQLMSEMAMALGKTERAKYYRDRHRALSASFAKLHVQPDGSLTEANQSKYAMALYFGLIPDGLKQNAANNLAKLIRDNGNKMQTGFLGTRPLLPVLSSHGHHDLAGILMQQTEYPSWGYEVENGATTIWERWNSFIKDEGVHEPGMNSFSHYAFGAVSEWMFAELGGISQLAPGYDLIRIAPRPAGTLTHCKVSTQVRHGKVATAWNLTDGTFKASITIPPNTKAVVSLPIADFSPQTLGSGTYSFSGSYLQD